MLVYDLASNLEKLLVFIRRNMDLYGHICNVYSWKKIKKRILKLENLSQQVELMNIFEKYELITT